MPVIPIEEKEEHKAVIRRILTMNPSLSVRELVQRLANASTPMKLDRVYVTGLVREIRQDRIDQINDQTKEDIYAQMTDLVEYVNNQLRAIAQEEKIEVADTKNKMETRIFAQNNRIKALNSIIDNTLKLANLKMDLGIIERKLGRADVQIIDLMSALKKIRNGDYTTPIEHLIPGTPTNYLADGSGEDSEAVGATVEDSGSSR